MSKIWNWSDKRDKIAKSIAKRWRAALRYAGSPRRPPSVTPHRVGPAL